MIILAGPPGSGKGTQADLLAERLGYIHLSVGALLREKAVTDPQIADQMKQGVLVNSEVLEAALLAALPGGGHERVILEGFPREPGQVAWLKNLLLHEDSQDSTLVQLVVSEATCQRRGQGRGRTDDTAETMARRLAHYRRETEVALKMLVPPLKLIEIDGEGDTEEVYAKVKTALGAS